MKILYLITKSNWGGAQRHVFDLAVYSHKMGHKVVVALGGEGMLNDRLKAAGIETRTLGRLKRDVHAGDDLNSFFDIFKMIRKERPDVLHLHSTKAGGLGALVGRILRVKKIVFTAHGWAFNEDRSFWERSGIALISWLTMLFCTDIITISEKEKKQAQQFPFVAQKVHMIHLGIHSPVFMSKSSVEIFLKSKIPDGIAKKIIIGTIAELHPNKGLTYAIEAMAKLVVKFPSTIFLIIGEGDQRKSLEELIKEKSLQKNIILAGYVENAVQYIKGFSIFLLPSIKEGLPYCLLEAGYASLPVVATTVGGIPEIIDDMKSGILIQSKKSEEISHALEFLIKHKNVQKEYGRNLQEKVRSEFNIEKMLEATMKLYVKPL